VEAVSELSKIACEGEDRAGVFEVPEKAALGEGEGVGVQYRNIKKFYSFLNNGIYFILFFFDNLLFVFLFD
jgi:hypothetical protein